MEAFERQRTRLFSFAVQRVVDDRKTRPGTVDTDLVPASVNEPRFEKRSAAFAGKVRKDRSRLFSSWKNDHLFRVVAIPADRRIDRFRFPACRTVNEQIILFENGLRAELFVIKILKKRDLAEQDQTARFHIEPVAGPGPERKARRA